MRRDNRKKYHLNLIDKRIIVSESSELFYNYREDPRLSGQCFMPSFVTFLTLKWSKVDKTSVYILGGKYSFNLFDRLILTSAELFILSLNFLLFHEVLYSF